MIIKRPERWGILQYDTLKHRFSYFPNIRSDAIPYTHDPVVLNVYLTMQCNMNCKHCVTKDFEKMEDLVVSKKMIDWINKSPFMVVVITGGEPFLPDYENELLKILREIHKKGLIIDTNGTILPSSSVIDTIVKTNTLVRVSWDSVRPQDEIFLRHVKPHTQRNLDDNLKCYYTKIDMIQRLRSEGVNVAVQSVIHNKNATSILENNIASILGLPAILREFHIKQLYLQRFIPSYLTANNTNLEVSSAAYYKAVAELTKKCNEENIECIAKKDRRHNCVFLLVGDGLLFTQGEKPGQKIPLGTIYKGIRYFDYVSSSDHSERYYG